MPGPNEILHQWPSEEELMSCLAAEALNSSHQAYVTIMGDKTDFGGAKTVGYDFSLVDGRGEPLRYPIKLVSRTTIGEAALDEFRSGGREIDED